MRQDGPSAGAGSPEEPAVDAVVDQLGALVRELLGRPVDPDENYFTAGLDSAMVVKLHTLMTRRMEVRLPVMALFRRPTVRGAAALIVAARAAVARDVAAGRTVDPARAEQVVPPSDDHPSGGPARRGVASRREIRERIRRDEAAR